MKNKENDLAILIMCIGKSFKLAARQECIIGIAFVQAILFLTIKDFSAAFYSFLIGSVISSHYVLKNKNSIYEKLAKLKGKAKSFISHLHESLSLSKNKSKTFKIEKEIQESKVDRFISMINSKIKELAQIRYPGFEQEVNDLYNLAIAYLDSKKDLNIVNGNYILMGNKIFLDKLNEIEERIKNKEKMQADQDINRQAINEAISRFNEEIPLFSASISTATLPEDSEIKLDTEPFKARKLEKH